MAVKKSLSLFMRPNTDTYTSSTSNIPKMVLGQDPLLIDGSLPSDNNFRPSNSQNGAFSSAADTDRPPSTGDSGNSNDPVSGIEGEMERLDLASPQEYTTW